METNFDFSRAQSSLVSRAHPADCAGCVHHPGSLTPPPPRAIISIHTPHRIASSFLLFSFSYILPPSLLRALARAYLWSHEMTHAHTWLMADAHLSHICHTSVTHLSHICHTSVTHLSHICHTSVTHLSHICHTSVTYLSHIWHTCGGGQPL